MKLTSLECSDDVIGARRETRAPRGSLDAHGTRVYGEWAIRTRLESRRNQDDRLGLW
jgi:hypothetical protein